MPQHRSFANCRILVVDDNAVNQKVAAIMLQRYGCMVDVAASGIEACNMGQHAALRPIADGPPDA